MQHRKVTSASLRSDHKTKTILGNVATAAMFGDDYIFKIMNVYQKWFGEFTVKEIDDFLTEIDEACVLVGLVHGLLAGKVSMQRKDGEIVYSIIEE